jgi:hypothetical protein
MNRAYHYLRALLLLALLHGTAGVMAQPGLEYWFDSYSDPATVSMPTAAGTLTANVNCAKLSQGFHTVFLRIKGGDGTYSPVYSSHFIKFAASGGSKLEYWFDGDVKKRATCDINTETTDEQELLIDLTDTERFPLGIHQFNFRVAAYGGNYSPVYSSLVMRMPAGSGNSVLEYWFDDNITKKATQPINTSLGTVQKLDLDMSNLAFFPTGFHKLSMRVVAHGTQYSPVYTAYVMKLAMGQQNSQITYWLDDDYKNGRHVISGRLGQGPGNTIDFSTIYFLSGLNFSNVPAGMHRLHYRITTNGHDHGPVYEASVLVSKRYNSLRSSYISEESFWLDDASTQNRQVGAPHQSVYTASYVLDPAHVTDGQHAFHVQYKNSAEVWSEQNITYFYKDPATARLHAGFMPADADGISNVSQAEVFCCDYSEGRIIIDCLSPRLGKTGTVQVCDMSGRVVAHEVVTVSDGIHAELPIAGQAHRLLIVRLVSGDALFTQKVIVR